MMMMMMEQSKIGAVLETMTNWRFDGDEISTDYCLLSMMV
jgi:hypothetical protein